GLRELGTTIFLTTHYMDEAQHLADRVVILREGKIVAEGSPENLGAQLGRETMISYRRDGKEHSISSADPQADLLRLLTSARDEKATLEVLEVRRPSLEDVFLELTSQPEDGR